MKLPAALAATALAVQVAGAPPPDVASAYARVAEFRPDIIANLGSKYGRKELLLWQAMCSQTLTKAQARVYNAVIAHYNHERRDAFPGYDLIAVLAKCCRRTAVRAVMALEVTGFLTVERRFRVVDRWKAPYRHDRTNVYRFCVGAPAEASACNGANEESRDAPVDDGAGDDRTAPSSPRPNGAPAPPRPTTPNAAPPGPSRPNVAPAPPRPTAPNATSLARPTGDPYWDAFETAFVLEHRAAYGKGSTPGGVRQGPLRKQVSDTLNDLVSECVAWAHQPEHGLNVLHPLVAEELARRLARAWIRDPGRDNRHRNQGHPLGWMCIDLSRTLCDEAVEGWKRAKRRLLPKPAPAARPDPTTASHEAAIKLAENTAVKNHVLKGVGFDQALRLGRAEGANMRAALGLSAPSLISLAAVEQHEPLVEPASRAPPE